MMFPFLEVCHVFFVGFDLSQGHLYIYFLSVGFGDVMFFPNFSPVKNGLVGSDHLMFLLSLPMSAHLSASSFSGSPQSVGLDFYEDG